MDNTAASAWRILKTFPADSPLASAIPVALAQGEELLLASGNEFKGRVATRLLRHQQHVLKLRLDITGTEAALMDVSRSRHELESRMRLHHPDKTWFVAVNGEERYAGNICPELAPIDQLLDAGELPDTDDFAAVLYEIFGMAFRAIADLSLNLDVSLSNFGMNTDTRSLYYLDDDVYEATADDFSMIIESISSMIRNNQDTPIEAWDRLGQAIREFVDQRSGPATVSRITYTLCEPPLLRPEAIERRNAVLKGFIRKKIKRSQVFQASKQPEITTARIGRRERGTEKIALLSDIHANAAALDAVLDELEKHNIISIIVAGDIVGYGPDPGACIDRIRQLDNLTVVQGNHDHGAGTLNPEEVIDTFNGIPRDILLWTKNVISDEQKTWLQSLPTEVRNDEFWLVHGSPKDRRKMFGYVYIMTYTDNLDVLVNEQVTRCIHGHTHVQGVYVRRGKQDVHLQDSRVTLEPTETALINPGSVGQPRGGKPGAEFALINKDMHDIEFFRIEYSTDDLFLRMREAGFPETLQTRISNGR